MAASAADAAADVEKAAEVSLLSCCFFAAVAAMVLAASRK